MLIQVNLPPKKKIPPKYLFLCDFILFFLNFFSILDFVHVSIPFHFYPRNNKYNTTQFLLSFTSLLKSFWFWFALRTDTLGLLIHCKCINASTSFVTTLMKHQITVRGTGGITSRLDGWTQAHFTVSDINYIWCSVCYWIDGDILQFSLHLHMYELLSPQV